MAKKAQQKTRYLSPFGPYELSRYPRENDPTLRAWSAADDYLLHYFHDERLPEIQNNNLITSGRLLVANDAFGTLSVALNQFDPVLWSDSHISRIALQNNLEQNAPNQKGKVTFVPASEPVPDLVHTVAMQLPKSHAFLRFQLERITPQLIPGSLVIAATMVKHFHPNVLRIFEDNIGETHTSLAKKKARLIFARYDKPRPPASRTKLADWASQYPLTDSGKPTLLTLPNVFSYEKLDIGTRALLPHIPASAEFLHILDLGCGNGALGIQAALQNPQARITFCDESYLAVESARLSAHQAGIEQRCEFIVTDTLKDAPDNQDLILCNPPFHQQNSVHTNIARRMFSQSRKHLAPSGRLLVVANRHLRYEQILHKLFGDVRLIDQNSKFVLLESRSA